MKDIPGSDLYGIPITPIQLIVCFVVFFLPNILVGVADFNGWLIVSAYRLQDEMNMLGLLVAVGAYGAMRKHRWAVLGFLAASAFAPSILFGDARTTQEIARWRLTLLNACSSTSASEEFLGQCQAAGVRPERVTCDFGKQSAECVHDLYRDAGWSEPTQTLTQQATTNRGLARETRQ